MAEAQLIDLSNYSTLLVQSSAGRAGTPDGNIFFDVTTGNIELITREELAQVNLGSGLEPNPLTNQMGIAIAALYAFERKERKIDENLRKFDYYFRGTFKFAGAYEIVNGRKFALTDRTKLRGSGWNERAANGSIDRIYFGVISLGSIEVSSQPYYQTAAGGAPADFTKAGPINEAIQVYGTTVNGDTGAGSFDSRTYLSNKVRTFGFNYDEKILADSGVIEMAGFSTGFALGESAHLTTGSYSLANVYGVSKIAPWTGMTLEKLAVPVAKTGFNQADGNFTWILNNTLGGNLNQCVAFLDALAQTDDDIDSGIVTETFGKRVSTWYTYNPGGQIVTRSGADALGLFIDNLPISDQQRIVQTDDTGALKTYPFFPEVTLSVGSFAAADANAWYHLFYLDGAAGLDYNTPDAVTVNDADSVPVKGPVSSSLNIVFAYAYDTNNQAGLNAQEDKDVVALCEGDGGATQAKTVFTITRAAQIPVSCQPGLETNL